MFSKSLPSIFPKFSKRSVNACFSCPPGEVNSSIPCTSIIACTTKWRSRWIPWDVDWSGPKNRGLTAGFFDSGYYMVNDRNGSFKGKSGCKHVQFIAGFYGAEVTTRARGGLVDKAWEHMYIVYNIRLKVIRITLDYIGLFRRFVCIPFCLHRISYTHLFPKGPKQWDFSRWSLSSGGLIRRPRWRMGDREEVFRSHYRSQCLFECFFWHVIAICHLWFGARFGDVSELWDAPTSTDLLLRVINYINFKRVL